VKGVKTGDPRIYEIWQPQRDKHQKIEDHRMDSMNITGR